MFSRATICVHMLSRTHSDFRRYATTNKSSGFITLSYYFLLLLSFFQHIEIYILLIHSTFAHASSQGSGAETTREPEVDPLTATQLLSSKEDSFKRSVM